MQATDVVRESIQPRRSSTDETRVSMLLIRMCCSQGEQRILMLRRNMRPHVEIPSNPITDITEAKASIADATTES
jgi:hypothetical protein